MKKLIVFLVVVLCFTSCFNNGKKEVIITNDIIKSEICSTIDLWHKNAADANFEAYFDTMTIESIFIGTDADENWTFEEFKNFSKPFFKRGKTWNFTAVDRNVYIYSNAEIAWFDELLDTWMGVCRGSGVVKKVNGDWKIEHYVLSLTVPNENIDAVVKVNKARDSVFLSKLK